MFRVDMRLRPFGDSGPLTASAMFLDNYLQTHGRDWERYAWVKARAVTGAAAYKLIQAESVRPFVYRRYLDFGVFEALREMKALIEKEVARRDLAEHVKLGPGGIREIEFVVQAFQLIRGGQDRRMQTPSLLAVAAATGRRQAAAGARRAGARSGLRVPAAPGKSPADAGGCAGAHHSDGRRSRASASRSPWASMTGRPAAPSSICTARGSRALSRKSCSRATKPRRPKCPASTASSKPGCAAPKEPQLAAALEARGFQRWRPGGGDAHRVSRQRHRCAGSTRPAARGSTR